MSQSSEQALSPAKAYEAARRFQAEGELEAAKRHYGHVLMNVPHHAEALIMLASIGYQQGDEILADAYMDRAIAIYGHVVAQMPQNLNVRGPLVNSLLARNRRQEAERYIDDLLLPLNPIRAEPQTFVRRRKEGIARGLPTIVINTLPKSASESIWNRLAEGLGLAQSHLSLGLFPDCCLVPARVKSAASGGLIAKEHLSATPFDLQQLADNGLTKVVFHVRDPRQATLSWAHFARDDVSMRLMAPIWRKTVPPAAILRADFATLLDWCIDRYLPIAIDFMRGWVDASNDPEQPVEVLFLTFEQFLSEPERYIAEVLGFYGIPPEAFAAEAEAEVVHMRRGLADEWRDVFTPAQQKRAWQLIPSDLAKAYGWTS